MPVVTADDVRFTHKQYEAQCWLILVSVILNACFMIHWLSSL